MNEYKGAKSGGVVKYLIFDDAIIIEFKDGSLYLYDETKPGKKHVDRMKELAVKGAGLTTYINQNVRDTYQEKGFMNGLKFTGRLKSELDKRYEEYQKGEVGKITSHESKKRIEEILKTKRKR